MPRANLSDALGQVHRLFGEGTLSGLTDAQLLDRHVSHGDELAFKALVQRHGPMVLAVCRGILNDANDADDAFQAVFLLLARKARSLWINDSLGGWLHRVSCRIAFRVKADTVRRRQEERRAAELAGGSELVGTPWDDTQTVVHEEIDRLPLRFREPIVLCYLEQMTYEQAARHLCWSEATTQGRLARARNLLRNRLARRGVTAGAATLASLAAPQGASAVSLVVFHAALRSARQFGLGEAARTATVSAAANVLVNQAVRSMMIAKFMNIGAAALVVGSLAAVVATSLPATGRTIKDEKEIARPPYVDIRRFAPPPHRSSGTVVKAQSGTKLLRGFRGADLEPDGRQRWYAARSQQNAAAVAAARGRTASAINLTKDLTPGQRLNRGDSLFSPLGGFRLTLQGDGDLALYSIDVTQFNGDVEAVITHRREIMKLYHHMLWSAGTDVASAEASAGTTVSWSPTAILSFTTRQAKSVSNRAHAAIPAPFSAARMTAIW